jgi:lysophospholipase
MARALPALLLCLALAACNRQGGTEPFAESRTPPDLGPRFFAPEGWSWGYVQVGRKPPQRYGVASTWRAPRANIVISPGYGESAETWFETARGLAARGYSVWVLDRAGQGGSGRYTLPRDLGYAPGFGPDVAALKSMVRVVVRPRPGTPLILLGHGDGAVVVLRAVETGLASDGVVLSSPRLAPAAAETVKGLAARLPLLDRLPEHGWHGWSRGGPDDQGLGLTHDPWRGAVTKAWQTANPDLRLAGPSLGWRRGFRAAGELATAEAGKVATPVLMLSAGAADPRLAAACATMTACQAAPIAGARPALHLEAEPWRGAWFTAVSGFIAGKVDRARTPQVGEDGQDSTEDADSSDGMPRAIP